MKWTKASERLPDNIRDDFYIKFDAGTDDEQKAICVWDGEYFRTLTGKIIEDPNLEWLDESIEEQPGEKQLAETNFKAYDKLWNENEDNKQEIERLKGLIEDAIKTGFNADEYDYLSLIVEDFKTKYNL